MNDVAVTRDVGLKRLLTEAPARFDFFQAVRCIERLGRSEAPPDADPPAPVGYEGPPQREAARFVSLAGFGFPATCIASIEYPTEREEDREAAPAPKMAVTFMGLAGAVGALPDHYTTELLHRVREKDFGLRDFFDLFNHRLISLFYRAWEKYRFEVAYERWKTTRNRQDAARPAAAWEDVDELTSALLSLVGLGTAGLPGRMAISDQTPLLYAGHFSHRPRNAASLQLLVSDFLAMPAQVGALVGQWLTLAEEERSRLSPGPRAFCQLGHSAVLGRRVWDVQSKIRLRVGPLTLVEYCELLPESSGIARLADLVRLYIGAELDADFQPVLKAKEIPACQVGIGARGAGGSPPPRLGRNFWLTSRPAPRDFDRAVFAMAGG